MAVQGLDQRELTLGGEQIYIQQMPTDKGLELACRLAKLLGGASAGFGGLRSQNGGGELSGQTIEINVGKIVDGLTSRMDHREVPQLIEEFVRHSMVRPEFSEEWYDIRFSGRYEQLLALMGVILDHNYGAAFTVLKKNNALGLGVYIFAWNPDGGINPPIMRPVRQGWVNFIEANGMSLPDLIFLNLEINRLVAARMRIKDEQFD